MPWCQVLENIEDQLLLDRLFPGVPMVESPFLELVQEQQEGFSWGSPSGYLAGIAIMRNLS